MKKSSAISGFYRLNLKERLRLVKDLAGFSDEEYTTRAKTSTHTLLASSSILVWGNSILAKYSHYLCEVHQVYMTSRESSEAYVSV